MQHGICDLSKIIEAAKSHIPTSQTGRLSRLREVCQRRKTKVRPRQRQQLFREIRIALPLRAVSVCQEIIYRRKPRAAHIAYAGKLDRRRPIGKNPQAVPLAVPAQFKEYIYLICPDPPCCCLIRQLCYLAPLHRQFLQPVRPAVLLCHGAVQIHLEMLTVKLRHEPPYEIQHRMQTKIRRKVANTQFPMTIGSPLIRLHGGHFPDITPIEHLPVSMLRPLPVIQGENRVAQFCQSLPGIALQLRRSQECAGGLLMLSQSGASGAQQAPCLRHQPCFLSSPLGRKDVKQM